MAAASRIGSDSSTAKFWRLGGGFFAGRRQVRAKLLVLILAALGILQIGVQLLVNLWSGAVFDAIEQRDVDGVLRQVAALAVLATAFLAFAGYHMHAKMRLQVDWRTWITQALIADWLAGDRPARLAAMGPEYDNPDQRIAEDVRLATESAVDFAEGIFSAVLTLVCFVGVLWSLSGSLRIEVGGLFAVSVPGYLVLAAVAYAAAGTFLTHRFGRPLVDLNQERLGREADFRIGLARSREDGSAEGPQSARRREIGETYAALAGMWTLLIRRTRRLTYVTAGYGVVGAGFPVLIAAPHYFSYAITLGGLMQATAAFVTVQTTLSWFVNNYSRFADWSASVERISGFRDALDAMATPVGAEGVPAAPDRAAIE